MSRDVSLYWMKTGNARKELGGYKKIKVRGERGGRESTQVGGKEKRISGTKRKPSSGKSTRNGQIRMRSRGRKEEA